MTPTDRNNAHIAFLGLGAWASGIAALLSGETAFAVLSGLLVLGLVVAAWGAR